jgi:XRE family transcriptional regulator, master regulator for biofilm formation
MIGRNINVIRRRRGLSLSELSEKSGISKSYLSNIERNIHKNPSIHIIEKISIVLNVDLNTLLIKDAMPDIFLEELELFKFAKELKQTGIEKEHIRDYQQLIDFIRWQKENS